MLIYLIRHGDKQFATRDPELSTLGLRQAEKLAEAVKNGVLEAPKALLSSQRIRAQQSLLSVARSFNLEVKIDNSLGEREVSENQRQFDLRILNFIEKAGGLNGPVFCCTHYDWLSDALNLLPMAPNQESLDHWNWMPLSYLGFSVERGLWTLQNKGQVLP
jgi:phosphohistidine phosphatase SixA